MARLWGPAPYTFRTVPRRANLSDRRPSPLSRHWGDSKNPQIALHSTEVNVLAVPTCASSDHLPVVKSNTFSLLSPNPLLPDIGRLGTSEAAVHREPKSAHQK